MQVWGAFARRAGEARGGHKARCYRSGLVAPGAGFCASPLDSDMHLNPDPPVGNGSQCRSSDGLTLRRLAAPAPSVTTRTGQVAQRAVAEGTSRAEAAGAEATNREEAEVAAIRGGGAAAIRALGG